MKVRHRIGPIHEDASPVDFEYETTIGPQDSIDLLQSPSGSDELTPNLAVIQELEEIRHIIELKSRDLSTQEAILSQSLDRLHIDHRKSLDCIRLKYDELVRDSTAVLERRFEKGALRVSNLLEKLNKRMEEFQTVQNSRRVVVGAVADTPPLPQKETRSRALVNNVQSVLDPRRIHRPPSERLFAFGLFSLLSSPHSHPEELRVYFSLILEYLIEGVDSILNAHFMSIMDDLKVEIPLLAANRFEKAKRGVVVKRLGLAESRGTRIEISLVNSHLPLKFNADEYMEELGIVMKENLMRNSAMNTLGPVSLVGSFLDQSVTKVIRNSIPIVCEVEPLLIKVLVSSVKDIGDSLRQLCTRSDLEDSKVDAHEWMKILKIVVFIYDRLGGALTDSIASQLTAILEHLRIVGRSRDLSITIEAWKQGVCLVIDFISNPNQTDAQNRVCLSFVPILEEVPSISQLLQPWRDSLLDIVQSTDSLDPSHMRAKMLLKFDSYS